MNKKKIGLLICAVFSLMFLVNVINIGAGADSVHLNFSTWEYTDYNDPYNILEINGSTDNSYRDYYQNIDSTAPYTFSEYFTVLEAEAETSVNYAFGQMYLTNLDDSESYESNTGHYEATYSEYSEYMTLNKSTYAEFDFHNELSRYSFLEYQDTSNTDDSYFQDYFTYDLIKGQVDFWFQELEGSDAVYFFIRSGYTEIIMLKFDNNELYYYDSGYQATIDITYSLWYYLSIDFDCTSNTYDLYINEIKIADDLDFVVSVDYVQEFMFYTDVADITNINIDSIGINYDGNDVYYNKEYIAEYTFNQTEYQAFNGTYHFENDLINDNPSEWTITETGGSIDVVYEANFHSKVVELDYDTARVSMKDTFSSTQTYGTIEYMFNPKDSINIISGVEGLNGASYLFTLYSYLNTWKYYSGGWKTPANIPAPIVDTWYNITIDFRCNGAPEYKGLGTNKVIYTVNGISSEQCSFHTTNSQCTSFNILSDTVSRIDAVDYFWSEGYYENRNQELENFSWNDSKPFDFEIDESGGTVEIINALDSHKNVLKFHDTSSSYGVYAQNHFALQKFGSIEFWFNINDATYQTDVIIQEGSTMGVYFYVYAEYFRYYDGSSHTIVSCLDNTWYHIKIDFECGSEAYQGLSADTFKVSINDVEYGAYPFWNGLTNSDNILIQTPAGYLNYISYIDALDYSWSDGYYENRNQEYVIESYNNSDYGAFQGFECSDSTIYYNGYHIFQITYKVVDGATVKYKIYFSVIKNMSYTTFYVYRADDSGYPYLLYQHISEFDSSVETLELKAHMYFGNGYMGLNGIYFKGSVHQNENETSYANYQGFIYTEYDDIQLYGVWYFTSADYNESITNQLHSRLRGIRLLYDAVNTYDSFIEFPLFNKRIAIPTPEPITPSAPTGTYWIYASYNIAFWYNDTIEVGDLSVDFSMIQVESQTAYFYYQLLSSAGAGNWGFFGEWNWLRDSLIWIVNILVMIPVQFLFYCLVVAFNFIIMFLIVGLIVVFFWNILVRNLIWLGMLIIWALWALFVVIYESVLVPFLSWMFEIGIPLIVSILIVVWSIILASFLWLLSFGQADYLELYNAILDLSTYVADFILDALYYFFTNLPTILMYSFAYVMLVFLVYLKYIYAKAKGYKNRAEQLYESYETYLIPFKIVYNMVSDVEDTIPAI